MPDNPTPAPNETAPAIQVSPIDEELQRAQREVETALNDANISVEVETKPVPQDAASKEELLEQCAARELGSPIAGCISFTVKDDDGNDVIIYAQENGRTPNFKRIWAATFPVENKYTVGQCRPKDRRVPQILEFEDRGKDIFTPIPFRLRVLRKLGKVFNRWSNVMDSYVNRKLGQSKSLR